LVALAGLSPAGCHTVEGIGEDIEAGGEALQELAEDHQ
jgi:predicted small secreted protein